jgi:hypothetical protein
MFNTLQETMKNRSYDTCCPDRDVLTDRWQLGKRNNPQIPQSGVKTHIEF